MACLTDLDIVEKVEVEGLELVNGGPDVLAVVATLEFLQLAGAGHVGQARLDVVQVRNL